MGRTTGNGVIRKSMSVKYSLHSRLESHKEEDTTGDGEGRKA